MAWEMKVEIRNKQDRLEENCECSVKYCHSFNLVQSRQDVLRSFTCSFDRAGLSCLGSKHMSKEEVR